MLHQLSRYLSGQAPIVSEHWGERHLHQGSSETASLSWRKMAADGEENKLKTGSTNVLRWEHRPHSGKSKQLLQCTGQGDRYLGDGQVAVGLPGREW